MFGIRHPILINNVFSGIDRRVVSLIVDEQKRKVSNDRATRDGVLRVCHAIANPVQKQRQNALVLFYNEQPRSLLRADAEAPRNSSVEISTIRTVGGIV